MNYMSRLAPYNTPLTYVLIGFMSCVLLGIIQPLFGVFMVDALVAMNTPPYNDILKEHMKEELRKWTLAMFGLALAGGIGQFFGKYYLAHVG